MKNREKRFVALLISIALVLACMPIANAANLGTLTYWYANYTEDSTTEIGRWLANSITIRATKINSNANFSFLTAIDHGVTQWKNTLGKTITSSSTVTSGDIEWYGGTLAEIKAYTGYTLPDDVAGKTRYYYKSTEGTWTYQNSTKTGYLFSFIYCYTVDNGYTANQYKNVSTHELGHALGWIGHSTSSSDVMYPTMSSITQLTTRDKNHLSQVY